MDCLAETGLTPLSSILVIFLALALVGAGLLVMRRQRRAGIAAIALLALLLGGGLALGPAHTATAATADCSQPTTVPAPTATASATPTPSATPTAVPTPTAAPTVAPTATPTPTTTPSATPSATPTPTDTPSAPACVPGAPVEPTSSSFSNTGEFDQVVAQFYLDDDDVEGSFRGTYDTWTKFTGAQAEALVAALGITVTVADGAEAALSPADVPAVPHLDVIPADLTVTETALYQGTLSRSLDGVLTIDLRHHYTVWTEDPDRNFVLPSLGEWESATITWRVPGLGLTCEGTPLLDTVVTDGTLD